MKLTIDIPSALLTLSAVGIAAVLAGAAPIQGSASDRDVQVVADLSQPHPRDFISLQSGASFTVPAGKIAVIESVSFVEVPPTGGWHPARVAVDGSDLFAAIFRADSASVNITPAIAQPGVMATEGQVITLTSVVSAAALGYLVDA